MADPPDGSIRPPPKKVEEFVRLFYDSPRKAFVEFIFSEANIPKPSDIIEEITSATEDSIQLFDKRVSLIFLLFGQPRVPFCTSFNLICL